MGHNVTLKYCDSPLIWYMLVHTIFEEFLHYFPSFGFPITIIIYFIN